MVVIFTEVFTNSIVSVDEIYTFISQVEYLLRMTFLEQRYIYLESSFG